MILCGVDFSPASRAALVAAAALARKQSAELRLVTILGLDDAAARAESEKRLAQEAAELRQSMGIDVDFLVDSGIAEERLLHLITTQRARAVVLGAPRHGGHARSLGSVAEALCRHAEVPVLLVRDAAGFVAWSHGQRTLRALLGSGLGDASKSALACVGAWPDVDATVLHVAWPFGEHYRLGVDGPLPQDHLLPAVEQRLLGDLGRWATEIPCRVAPKLRAMAGWKRIDAHLAERARELETDLLVVGTHRRNIHDAVWEISVSRSTINEAPCNVLCVPQSYLRPRSAPSPRLVVVPTDFTPLGDRAISFGASLLSKGGSLHLIHVTTDPRDEAGSAAISHRLQQRLPSDLELRGVDGQVRVLHGNPIWLAVWQHATRTHADLICLATHSRDAAHGFALGSKTKALLQHADLPVVLVPQDRES